MFSGAVKIADLDDYITPSQNCVVPILQTADKKPKKVAISMEGEPDLIKIKDPEMKTAKVTLNDCLACSGCVTSAETVLIQEQSTDEFIKGIAGKFSVVALSSQTVYSLSRFYQLPVENVLTRLDFVLSSIGVNAIVNFDVAVAAALEKAYDEFKERIIQKKEDVLFCGECPGWICYAEKKVQPEIVENISNVKSPQQILGRLLKENITECYFSAFKPCFDKKLEAVRPDFVSRFLRS